MNEYCVWDMRKKNLEVEVRRVSSKDLDKVQKIERISFPDPWPMLEFQLINRLPKAVFLIAELKNLTVGYIVANIENHLLPGHDGLSGRILNLAVDPAFKRRGVGSRLLDEAVELLDVKEVCLEVRKSNRIAISFYMKHGFKRAGTAPSYYGDEDAVIMVKTYTSLPVPKNDEKDCC